MKGKYFIPYMLSAVCVLPLLRIYTSNSSSKVLVHTFDDYIKAFEKNHILFVFKPIIMYGSVLFAVLISLIKHLSKKS